MVGLNPAQLLSVMALVRILVDGSGLARCWTKVLPGKDRQSPAVLEELVRQLTQYQDICGVPISVVFDGKGVARVADDPMAADGIEVLFSRIGQSPTQLLVKLAQKFGSTGELSLVASLTAHEASGLKDVQVVSCEDFARSVDVALEEMERALKKHNDSEDARFRASGF